MLLKEKGDVPDVTELEPERFKRAVRAGCATNDPQADCTYPECGCDDMLDVTIRAAILAWEAPQHLGD